MRRDPQLVRADQANLRTVEATIAKTLASEPGAAEALRASARVAIEKGAIDGRPPPLVSLGRQPERSPPTSPAPAKAPDRKGPDRER